MKQGLHPQWNHEATVTCACGNSFVSGSSLDTVQVDICNKCHPFFTGELRFVDRQGRVDKFMQKMQLAQQKQAAQAQKTKKTDVQDDKPAEPAKSYQEILRDQQAELKKAKAA